MRSAIITVKDESMKTSDGPNSSEKQLLASARIKDVATVRKPLIQIPSHVFVFSLMMAPVAACCKSHTMSHSSVRLHISVEL